MYPDQFCWKRWSKNHLTLQGLHETWREGLTRSNQNSTVTELRTLRDRIRWEIMWRNSTKSLWKNHLRVRTRLTWNRDVATLDILRVTMENDSTHSHPDILLLRSYLRHTDSLWVAYKHISAEVIESFIFQWKLTWITGRTDLRQSTKYVSWSK